MRNASLLLCTLVALMAGSADLRAQTAALAPGTDAYYTQKIIANFQIGNSSPVEEDRRVGWNIKSAGWAGFVKTWVKPSLDWGARRVELHLPFGCQPNQAMDADGYVEAQDAGQTWLTDGFVEAWTPVMRGDYTNGEPVEVIAYMGSLRSDPDMMALMAEPGSKVVDKNGVQIGWMSTRYNAVDLDHYLMGKAIPNDKEGTVLNDDGQVIGYACGGNLWRARAKASFAAVVAAGMSIGFDGASGWQKFHPAFAFRQGLEDSGIRTYIETWPDWRGTHWFDANIIVANYTWYSRWFMVSGWPVKRTSLTGELIRFIERPGITTGFDSRGNPVGTNVKTITNDDGTTSVVPLTWADVNYGYDETVFSLANDYTVLVNVRYLALNNITLKQICDGARALAAANAASN